jgi:hypothetical protein
MTSSSYIAHAGYLASCHRTCQRRTHAVHGARAGAAADLNLDLQLCTLEYCTVGCNKTPDIALSLARRDHRKSKFGLRHRTSYYEAHSALYGDEVRILIFDRTTEN